MLSETKHLGDASQRLRMTELRYDRITL